MSRDEALTIPMLDRCEERRVAPIESNTVVAELFVRVLQHNVAVSHLHTLATEVAVFADSVPREELVALLEASRRKAGEVLLSALNIAAFDLADAESAMFESGLAYKPDGTAALTRTRDTIDAAARQDRHTKAARSRGSAPA